MISLAILLLGLEYSEMLAFPNLEWYKVETKRFRIIWHEGLDGVAKKVASMSEEVLKELVAKTGIAPPSFRTNVILFVSRDLAYGFATFFPEPSIYISLSPDFTTSFYKAEGDQLRSLVAHELAHILSLSIRCPVYKVIGYILGSLFSPNTSMPRFIQEGFATDAEYLVSRGGIISEPIELYTKSLSEEDIVGETPWFPWHLRHYILGASFISWLRKEYGGEKVADFFKRNSCKLPYMWSLAFKETFKIEFEVALAKWLEERKRAIERRITFYEAKGGVTVAEKISQGRGVFLKLNGNLLFTSNGSILENGRKVTRRDDGFWLSARRGKIVFDVIRRKGFYSTRKVMLFDGSLKEIATGYYPDISPDGKFVVFISKGIYVDMLCFLEIETGKFSCPLVTEDKLYFPRFSPSGELIALSVWRRNGDHDIAVYVVPSLKLTFVTQDIFIDFYPTWTPDERYIIFSSSRDGFFNLYAWSITESALYRLTRLVSGAFESATDGKNLWFTSVSEDGFTVFKTDFNLKERVEVDISPSPHVERKPASIKKERLFFPLFSRPVFIPSLAFSRYTGLKISALLAASDVLYRHNLVTIASFMLPMNELREEVFGRPERTESDIGVITGYLLKTFPLIDIGFFIGMPSPLLTVGKGGEDEIRYEDSWGGKVDIIVPVLRRSSLHLKFGLLGAKVWLIDRPPPTDFGKELERKYNEFGSGWFTIPRIGFMLRTTRRTAEAFSLERGVNLQGKLELLSERSFRSSISIDWYRKIFKPVLYIGLRGVTTYNAKKRLQPLWGGLPLILEPPDIPYYPDLDLSLSSYIWARGLGVRRSPSAAVATVEIRSPVAGIWKGIGGSIPIFLKTISFAPFLDIGSEPKLTPLRLAVGSELRTDFLFSHYAPLTLRVGAALEVRTRRLSPYVLLEVTEGLLR